MSEQQPPSNNENELPEERKYALDHWPTTNERIPLAALFVDDGYQRKLKHKWIKHTVETFDGRLFLTLWVSDRGNGTYAVIDGQQRLEVIRILWPNATNIPCTVYRNLTREDEGYLFAKTQKKGGRSPLTVNESFKAETFIHDPVAMRIIETVESVGFNLVIDAGSKTPGSINAVGTLLKIDEEGGIDDVRATLELMRDGWGLAGSVVPGWCIAGIHRFHAHFRGRYERARVVELMQSASPATLRREANDIMAALGGNVPYGIARAILKRYNRNFRAGSPNRLEW